MTIAELLKADEGKTLEFKQGLSAPRNLFKTLVGALCQYGSSASRAGSTSHRTSHRTSRGILPRTAFRPRDHGDAGSETLENLSEQLPQPFAGSGHHRAHHSRQTQKPLAEVSAVRKRKTHDGRWRMKNRETARFAICARGACIVSGLQDLNAEAVLFAATIKNNFEELGV